MSVEKQDITLISNRMFCLGADEKGICLLQHSPEEDGMNFLMEETAHRLDACYMKYSIDGVMYRLEDSVSEPFLCYRGERISIVRSAPYIRVVQHFYLDDEQENLLFWDIHIENLSISEVVIEELKLPLVMNTDYTEDTVETYTHKLLRHTYLSGHASYFYWQKPSGDFPCLLMIGRGDTEVVSYETDQETARPGFGGIFYIFLQGSQEQAVIQGLAPSFGKIAVGGVKEYGFQMTMAFGEQEIRDQIYESGRPDLYSVPGMVIPKGMDVFLAIRSKTSYRLLVQADVKWVSLGQKGGYQLYQLQFLSNGIHQVNVAYGGGIACLQYFATEGVEHLLKKRAGHMIKYQQYRGSGWYDGLFTLWNMEEQVMVTPDNRMDLPKYCTGGADDPGLCKAPFLAQKNYYYPDREEIHGIEVYIKEFLWGGLQRTELEQPYAYGIYGSDYWVEHRNSGSGMGNGGHGEEHLWRTFDYTHIIGLYHWMYRIARKYPGYITVLDAPEYLKRAYHTAKAYFEIPYSIYMRDGWDFTGYTDWAYKQGNFHEVHIPLLIDDLKRENEMDWAEELRVQWEHKVRYMVYDHPYPFGSEMWFDSTAFESTHAIAKYGLEHQVLPCQNGFLDKNKYGPGQEGIRRYEQVKVEDFEVFMEREIKANVAARGSIAPVFYHMGSDVRATGDSTYQLSYMTQLGGWAVLDYGLYYAPKENRDYMLQLGYASYLASYALIHTGEDYPWYPGEKNQGAAGWAYEPEYRHLIWVGDWIGTSPWKYDGEIDSGFSGAMRTACSVLYEDSIFGIVYLGGHMEQDREGITLIPADGLSVRVHLMVQGRRIHLESESHRIARILCDPEISCIQVAFEQQEGEDRPFSCIIGGSINSIFPCTHEGVQIQRRNQNLFLRGTNFLEKIMIKAGKIDEEIT